jgi:hypothetical protein
VNNGRRQFSFSRSKSISKFLLILLLGIVFSIHEASAASGLFPKMPAAPKVYVVDCHNDSAEAKTMDPILDFKNGSISGQGADDIGLFVISGLYDTSNGECSWVKKYVGRHSVDYRGFRETKGIWGTWHILHTKGGFHIWPLSEGEPLTAAEVEEEIGQPAKTGVTITQR